MIDFKSRIEVAMLMENFRDGRITNYVFIDSWPQYDKHDRGLKAIESVLWFTYDDVREHKSNLSDKDKALYNRCIAFLRSDLEYQWAYDDFTSKTILIISGCIIILILATCIFGFLPKIYIPVFITAVIFGWYMQRCEKPRWQEIRLDDENPIWPFFTTDELQHHIPNAETTNF